MYIILIYCATEASPKRSSNSIYKDYGHYSMVDRGSYIFLLTNSMNYAWNSSSDMSKCMNYISGMVVKMGVALLRAKLKLIEFK